MFNRHTRVLLLTVAQAFACLALTFGNSVNAADAFRSPFGIAVSPDGKTAYVSDRTAANLTILDVATEKKKGEIALNGQPHGVALSADGSQLYVAERLAGTVAVIDTAKAAVVSRLPVNKWPTEVAIGNKTKRLFVTNEDTDTVSVIDLAQGKTLGEVKVTRDPCFIAVSPDESTLVVTNKIPYGKGTDPKLAADVSIINATEMSLTKSVKLTPGSTAVFGACISPDGKHAYVVHGLGRFHLPITQLERGWVNTFALTVIDIAKGERTVTVLLDDLTQGAADPFAIVCSGDGKQLWISHAGVHSISKVNIGLVHQLLAGDVPAELASLKDGSQANIWMRIKTDPKLVSDLENDLTALYIAGAIHRFDTGGNGPRGIALSPDEKQLLVTNYYSGTVTVLDSGNGNIASTISMGENPKITPERRGERIFHDAHHAFQHWHSCSTCHVSGHTDGLRWDFLGDGIGNAKDTMNLIGVNETGPLNRRATVVNAKVCAENGLKFTNMLVPTQQEIDDMYAFLCSLKPEPSFHFVKGKPSESAERGKEVFERAGCVRCHPGKHFTDQKMHNVGVLSANEPDGKYDTPSLIEAYRTAPYLHDGRALTIKEIFTEHNPGNRHGRTKSLSPEQLEDLVNYILSL